MQPNQAAADPTPPATASRIEATSVSVVDVIAEPLALAAPVAMPATAIPLQIEWSNRVLMVLLAIWAAGFAFHALAWLRECMRAGIRLRKA